MTEELKKKKILVTHVKVNNDEFVKTFEIRLPAHVKKVTGIMITSNTTRWRDG
jgi:hypothetical protein